MSISHVRADYLVDIDGSVETADEFYTKFGWSPVGEECNRTQFNIGGKTFAVLGAYCQTGFLHWKIFDGTVSDDDVATFVEELRTRLPPNSFGLFDNASNQRTPLARNRMEAVFNGRYKYCSAYSPELKPVENGLSNVKCWIRTHVDDLKYRGKPKKLINAAFHHYSPMGPAGITAYHHFDFYRELHALHNEYVNAV